MEIPLPKMSDATKPACGVPDEGEIVVIECGDQRFEAVVGKKSPRGDFSVSWYAGSNRWAPYLRGHWYTEFGPEGEPKYAWRIVERLGKR